MRDLLLGLDIGTQGAKGIIVDRKGLVLAKAALEHTSQYPRPDWCEHDMLQNWWHNPVSILRSLLQAENVSAARIAAVSISGVFPVFGPTDSKGNPLRGAILYSDNRAQKEIVELNETLGFNLTGESLTPKLLWFLRNEPELASKMSMFFDAAHFAIFKLTGRYVLDTITAGLFGAIYDAPAIQWHEYICERFVIPPKVLPTTYPPTTIVGQVHRDGAEETRLEPGTPVLTGLPDLVASSLSVGVVEKDKAILYYGTAGVIPILKGRLIDSISKPFPEKERLTKGGIGMEEPFITGPHGISGYVYDYPAYALSSGEDDEYIKSQGWGITMKIVIGSIMHESNTFAPTVTDIEVFKRTQYLTGDDIIKCHLNQRSEFGCEASELTFALIEEKIVLKKAFIKMPLITPAENRSGPVIEMAS